MKLNEREKGKNSVLIIFLFIIISYFGYLSHEFGHWIVAEVIGFDPKLHYNFTSTNCGCKIMTNENVHYLTLHKNSHLLILIGGVFSTISLGTIGLILTILHSNKKRWQLYFYISLSFFWIREIISAIKILYIYLFDNDSSLFLSDELQISSVLNVNLLFFSVILGFVGVLICFYTLTKIEFVRERIYFCNLFKKNHLEEIHGNYHNLF